MENLVFAAVLFAAACHAGWNAIIKIGLDPLSSTTLIAVGAAVVGVSCLPLAGLPAVAAWPWLMASVVIHLFYFAALAEGYRAGDLGQVYPLARGSAPLMTAAASTVLVGERLSVIGWSGIAALAAGTLLLSARGGRSLANIDRRAVGFALATALTICAYSVVDGLGARASRNAVSYVLLVFIGNAVLLAAYASWRNPGKLTPAIARYWPRGLIGGALSVAAYCIVLWAMTVAPIAVVAALRETSVMFGAILAVVWLKEPLRAGRVAAVLLIAAGLVLIRMQ